MANDCIVVKQNLGLSQCNKLPAMPSSMITTPVGFRATPVQAIDPDFWQAALLAGRATRIYLWPNFVHSEDVSEAAVYEDSPLAVIPVRSGKYRFRFSISQNLCLHRAMFTHKTASGRVIILDNEEQMIMTEDDNGNLMGFAIQLLNPEKMILSNGTVATKSPVYLALQDPKELDQRGVIVSASFLATLNRLTDVTLAIVAASVSANSLQVDVTVACDGTGVSGLVLADFTLLKTDGSAETTPPSICVESTTVAGRYTISKVAGVAWVDGTLGLKAASVLSIEGWESTGSVLVDVP